MAAKRRKPSTIFAAGDMVAGRYHETAGLQATSRRAHALANRVGAIAERLHLRRRVEGTKAGTRWAAAACSADSLASIACSDRFAASGRRQADHCTAAERLVERAALLQA